MPLGTFLHQYSKKTCRFNWSLIPTRRNTLLLAALKKIPMEVGGRGWLELISSTGTVVWADSAVGGTGGNIGRSRTLVKRLKKAILKR